MTYWILYGTFGTIETFTFNILPSIIPLYDYTVTMFFMCIQINNNALYISEQILRPLLIRYKNHITSWLNQVSNDYSYDSLVSLLYQFIYYSIFYIF